MIQLSENTRSRAALHQAVPLPEGHRLQTRRKRPGLVRRFFSAALQMVGATAPSTSVDIPLTTVSLGGSFDAYLHISFVGAAPGTEFSIILDSGNSMLVVPYWEDIEAIPNWQANYTILGQAPEPWHGPANVVQGPIQIITETGDPFVIENCVFYACTVDAVGGGRTSNFGAGCLQPWSASSCNTPGGIGVTMKSPLAYATNYPFAEFNYAAAGEIFNASNPQGVSEQSTLRLYPAAPSGYQFLKAVSGCAWMSLRPKHLQIAGTVTGWPAPDITAIAMIDSGGTSVGLSDPTGLVWSAAWPPVVANPSGISDSVNASSTKANLQIELGDDQGSSFTYEIDEAALPPSAQGRTLVMFQEEAYMRNQYGMNTGGLSLLAIRMIVDYITAAIGFRPL